MEKVVARSGNNTGCRSPLVLLDLYLQPYTDESRVQILTYLDELLVKHFQRYTSNIFSAKLPWLVVPCTNEKRPCVNALVRMTCGTLGMRCGLIGLLRKSWGGAMRLHGCHGVLNEKADPPGSTDGIE